MSVLVIDIGSSSVRASRVEDDGTVSASRRRATPPHRPAAGVVELDPVQIAGAALELGRELIDASGPVGAVGIATQRATSVVWEHGTRAPVGPALSWQDIRTTGQCLALRASGLRLQPSQSATKFAWLLERADPSLRGDLRCGTLDSWVASVLTEGELHVTDASNAAVTGLVVADGSDWDDEVLAMLGIARDALPDIVDSSGVLAPAHALPGAPPLAALLGDQQASLLGQGGVQPGALKATFGTGAMVDCCLGALAVPPTRGTAGTFPIICWRIGGLVTWGAEAIMLSAGSCVDWLRDGLGLITSAAETDSLAGSVRDAGGVVFVPALGGLGTPLWDYGARGTIVGISAATTRAEIVRAVLEGIAHRARDLIDAIAADTGLHATEVRVDGGMSENATFLQLVANAFERPVVRSVLAEATTLGAGLAAGVATGMFADLSAATSALTEGVRVEPVRALDRERWLDARERSLRTVPALSMLSF